MTQTTSNLSSLAQKWHRRGQELQNMLRQRACSEAARELLTVKAAHDWDEGQVWGGEGTRLSCTDTCRICGLTRSWLSDRQNGIEDRYTFSDAHGHALTLREASQLEPCIEEEVTT